MFFLIIKKAWDYLILDGRLKYQYSVVGLCLVFIFKLYGNPSSFCFHVRYGNYMIHISSGNEFLPANVVLRWFTDSLKIPGKTLEGAEMGSSEFLMSRRTREIGCSLLRRKDMKATTTTTTTAAARLGSDVKETDLVFACLYSPKSSNTNRVEVSVSRKAAKSENMKIKNVDTSFSSSFSPAQVQEGLEKDQGMGIVIDSRETGASYIILPYTYVHYPKVAKNSKPQFLNDG